MNALTRPDDRLVFLALPSCAAGDNDKVDGS